MDKEIIKIVDQIIKEDFKNEYEVYQFEKEDAIKAIKDQNNIISLVDEEFVNGLGIPEPGILAWIPILYTTYIISGKVLTIFKNDTKLETIRDEYEKELVKNGLDEKKAKQLTKKHFKKIYRTIQQKIIN